MYGPSIESQFQHIEFEKQQLKRRMAVQRQFEAEQQDRERPRRWLVDIFGQFVDRLDPRVPARRSPVAQS